MNMLPKLSASQQEWLTAFSQQLDAELHTLLAWWIRYGRDEERGGLWGRVNDDNKADPDAAKGLVLHSRAVWTFAAAYLHTGVPLYRTAAESVFHFLEEKFLDTQHGGYYWSVDAHGNPLDTKKQVYGQAFALYGMAKLYEASGNEKALLQARQLFELLEQKTVDPQHDGYIEAFEHDWQPRSDFRLSAKEENLRKTMNTHLHVIEAYAALYKVWKDPVLARRIRALLDIFQQYIIDPDHHVQHLFFTDNWQPVGQMVSFGHDIEAAWLLHECALVLEDADYINKYTRLAVDMARTATRGLDTDGGLWYEYDAASHHLVKEKHWWPQAEAMVGFFNAWQLTGDPLFEQKVQDVWSFIRQYIKDHKQGEWFWGVDALHQVMKGQDKAGFWKCPYHNGRACMELSWRIRLMLAKQPADDAYISLS